MPVHRHEGRQAVFAFDDDLDAWMASREVNRSPTSTAVENSLVESPVLAPAAEAPELESAAPPPSAIHQRRVLTVALVAVLILGVIATFVLLPLRPDVQPPSKLVLEGRRIVARDSSGNEVWRYDVRDPVRAVTTVFRPDLDPGWARMDVDGDGIDELVTVVSHSRHDTGTTETLYCFTLGGKLRYSFTPDLKLTFGGTVYSGPWRFWDFEPVPEDRSVWAALEIEGWWPSAVVRIDGSGKATLRYAQPGASRLLRTSRYGGRLLALVAGVNNELRAASVAVLDPLAIPSSPPQEGKGPFTCTDCPAGRPLKYFLFAPSPLNLADGLPFSQVSELRIAAAHIEIGTHETDLGRIWYRLTPDLHVLSATPSDNYWTWKPRFDPAWRGRVGHPSTIDVRSWESGRWSLDKFPLVGVSDVVKPVVSR